MRGAFIQRRVGGFGSAAIAREPELLMGSMTQYGMGAVSLLEYVFHPVSILLVYFTLEGMLRAFAGALTDETPGSLPFYLILWGHERAERAYAERALGPRVADEVERGDGKHYDLRISSCRPKKDWNRLITVALNDVFYEVVKHESSRPPHRFVYLLRKIPPGKVIRGLHHYHPDEVLLEKKK